MTAIVSASGLPGCKVLLDDLDGALVSWSTIWSLDFKVSNSAPGADFTNGLLPVRAFVPSHDDYQGEIVIWVEEGHLSTMEFPWIGDTPPIRWPRPDEMEIIRESDLFPPKRP